MKIIIPIVCLIPEMKHYRRTQKISSNIIIVSKCERRVGEIQRKSLHNRKCGEYWHNVCLILCVEIQKKAPLKSSIHCKQWVCSHVQRIFLLFANLMQTQTQTAKLVEKNKQEQNHLTFQERNLSSLYYTK